MRVTRINHIAIAVHDMDPLQGLLGDVFGLGEPHREEGGSGLQIAVFPAGDSAIELLRPTTEGSSVPAFLREKGAGLFHLCLEVDDIDAAMAELRGRGLRFRSDAPLPGHAGSRIAFIDPANTGGVLFELLEPARGEAPAHAG